jgi:hypothetical protein
VTIEEIQGIAMGEIGLTRSDFLSLTPEELKATMEVWRENRQAEYRDRWERTRLIAAFGVMPHSKKIRRATDLWKFEWEAGEVAGQARNDVPGQGGNVMTKEEHRRRMEELRERWK